MTYDKDTLFPFLDNSNISEFYKNIVKSWHASHVVCNLPETLMEIKNEIIWGNRYILSKNATLHMKHWIKCDIVYIGDICNINGFLRADLLKAKFKEPNANFFHEFKIIIDSIPKVWRDLIKESTDLHWKKEHYFLKWNEQMYTLQELNNINCKLVYSFLVKQKATQANSECFWNHLFQKEIDWDTIWIDQTIKLTRHMKLAEFNFKILHIILPSGILLHRWKIINSDSCTLCNVPEDYRHMFILCQRVDSFWTKVSQLLYKTFTLNIDIDYESIVLGHKSHLSDAKILRVINVIITLGKYAIFRSWCKYRNDRKNFQNINLFNIFKHDVNLYSSIERHNRRPYTELFEELCSRL
jgi:hypothetical protein